MPGEAQGPLTRQPLEQSGTGAAARMSGPQAQRWVLGESRADGLEVMLG